MNETTSRILSRMRSDAAKARDLANRLDDYLEADLVGDLSISMFSEERICVQEAATALEIIAKRTMHEGGYPCDGGCGQQLPDPGWCAACCEKERARLHKWNAVMGDHFGSIQSATAPTLHQTATQSGHIPHNDAKAED